jgi:hypothetical protein
MKKIFAFLMAALMLLVPVIAIAEAPAVEATPDAIAEATAPLTWEYLTTVGGAAAFVLIIVQLTKDMLDKIWKIPTTLYAYILAVITMILATAFTAGLTPSGVLLTLFNGWIVSATASKTFDTMSGK